MLCICISSNGTKVSCSRFTPFRGHMLINDISGLQSERVACMHALKCSSRFNMMQDYSYRDDHTLADTAAKQWGR